MNFLQFYFEFTGTLLKIKSSNEKSMDKLLHAVLPVFFICGHIAEDATAKYLLSSLRPG